LDCGEGCGALGCTSFQVYYFCLMSELAVFWSAQSASISVLATAFAAYLYCYGREERSVEKLPLFNQQVLLPQVAS
jgi:hypothetical protein